jgi:anaerobic ribonucleoside-triphosphate reductase activating protein
VAPEDLPFEGGEPRVVDDLATELNALPPEVGGLTLSGGEPMAQAAALVQLVRSLRSERDWSVMSYTGYTIEHLTAHGTDAQRDLIGLLDILVDGPYQAARHGDLLWRGSANQRLHFLTGRHRHPVEDRSAGLEIDVSDGALAWVGVPPVPGFRESFEDAMAAADVRLSLDAGNPAAAGSSHGSTPEGKDADSVG